MYDTLKLISRLEKLHKSQKRSYTRENLFDIQKITILQNRQDQKTSVCLDNCTLHPTYHRRPPSGFHAE